jgi:hypothetical protein
MPRALPGTIDVRERLTTLVCALGALAVFLTLFVHGQPPDAGRAAPPTTDERGDNGLWAARQWLEREGVRTLSWRERFDALAHRADLPPSGNLLIVTTPAVNGFKTAEVRSLEHWVQSGNTLLVLAALSDRPAWSLNGVVHNDLSLLTGLEFVHNRRQPDDPQVDRSGTAGGAPRRFLARAPERLAQPFASTVLPNREHPYFAGVNSAVARSDYLPEIWELKIPRAGFALALAHQQEFGEGVLWVRDVGRGTVVVSAFASLFSNRTLGLADNARLLANLVTSSLDSRGVVIFDDEHQGLVAAYDPAHFYRDPRLYATLGILLAVWLVWVLGGTRLRATEPRLTVPREAQLVRTTGVFLARVLREPAAARRLFEHFAARLRRRLPDKTPRELPWDWLENHPRLAAADIRQLRAWYADAYSDRRVPLLRLHNLIVQTERQLAA